MSSAETNIHVLDAAYKPFPTFAEWASRASVDTVRWDRYNASLNGHPDLSPEILKRAREIVKRAAALDTGAIEGLYEVDRGFTFTVALETTAWELKLAEKGENVRSLFEAQLHAYDYVLDLATKAEPISEAAIRKLHEVVCSAQLTYRVMTAIGPQEQELTKGRYKVLPNHVRTRDGLDHSYAPVDVTPPEMARLVSEMRTKAFQTAHPVLQAAYAHYGLVVIHPFADGNGRVARALASVFTYRAISIPIMILSEHKNAYLDSLEAADAGKPQVFVDFMMVRSLDTIQLVEESLRGAHMPTPESGAAAINSLYITKGGYEQARVNEAGSELAELILAELGKSISSVAGPNLNGQANFFVAGSVGNTPNPTHRLLLRDDSDLIVYSLEFHTSAPASARLDRKYALWLPKDANSDDDMLFARIADNLAMVTLDMNKIAFSARISDLIPAISGVLQIRTSIFADRLVGEILAELKLLVQQALHVQP
jgi:Fic family protein